MTDKNKNVSVSFEERQDTADIYRVRCRRCHKPISYDEREYPGQHTFFPIWYSGKLYVLCPRCMKIETLAKEQEIKI
jgi:hypothetical protein